ncbi:hypothetical protein K438DRAFT_1973200 [Mycena galopus ATCC 62051]|nr:hypothetical protein K438DRAFT_1973200 [Mycena galopus ATCC 62051]
MGTADDEHDRDNIWEGSVTVWHAWEPEVFGGEILFCKRSFNGSLNLDDIMIYLRQKNCQKEDWSKIHKKHCHLFEANRKLSSVFAKSLGPGTINDPTLSLKDKVPEWNFLNIANHLVIASAAMKNDPKFAGTVNVAILLSCADERAGSKYEHRTFFIDRVLLLQREASNAAARVANWYKSAHSDQERQEQAERTDNAQFKLMAGWCTLPGGEVSATQMWVFDTEDVAGLVLPPDFDLNRYVTHVNRGITHFHASFWPIPRNISDAALELESAKMPKEWKEYAKHHHDLLSGLKGGQGIIGRILPDGTRVPVYKVSNGGHFRKCAPGETDLEGPAAFQKPLVDPSKTVQFISRHLATVEEEQRVLMDAEDNKFESYDPSLTVDDYFKHSFPGYCD